MEYIEYNRFPEFVCHTLTKECKKKPEGASVHSFFVSAKKGERYVLYTSDEIPFVFYSPSKGIYGATSINKDESLSEMLLIKFHAIMVQYNLEPKEIYCYLGPSLTFSHTIVERPLIESLMEKGYRAAAKRTSGVDFFDMPVMNVLMLRKLGIPFANITIDNHDTYECDSLLNSKMRGDNASNATEIELLK
jgi:copper oxidase (laccase) domain-containing protein